jgi:ubiquinone biosynthesis protein
MPYQVSDVLERLRDGTFQVRLENPGIDEIDDHIDKASNRLSVALIVAGGLVGSAIIGVFADEGPHVMGLHLLSVLGFLISGAFGLWLVWGVMRHGRL